MSTDAPGSPTPPNPLHARKPSRSGADTPRSGSLIQHGGKVDPRTLRAKILGASSPDGDGPASDVLEDDAPIIQTGDIDQQASAASDDDAPNRVVFVLQRDLDKRLDKYLCDRITFMSRTQLQRLIDDGGVTVNAKPCKASTKLRAGDRVDVFVPPPPPTETIPQDIPIDVLFEDEHIIVLNKQPNIIVHPARGDKSGTLINALAFHFQNRSSGNLSQVGKDFARPGVVHRLDRHTSGLIIFAKSDEAHWKIGTQFERRTVDKRYLALVHGVFEPAIDPVDLPIGPHPSRERGYREMQVVRHDHLGKTALTIVRTRQIFRPGHIPEIVLPADAAGPVPASAPGWKPALCAPATPRVSQRPSSEKPQTFSLVELELKTGRTHQIRVHLTHRGYPIVGDDMYGGRTLYHAAAGGVTEHERDAAVDSDGELRTVINRQALHATTLSFRHPMDGRVLSFQAPLPPDMRAALEALRAADTSSTIVNPPGATINFALGI